MHSSFYNDSKSAGKSFNKGVTIDESRKLKESKDSVLSEQIPKMARRTKSTSKLMQNANMMYSGGIPAS